MGYRPPKGVRPPQLEGKRTGRPKGSKDRYRPRQHSEEYDRWRAWEDIRWALANSHLSREDEPTWGALIWSRFLLMHPGTYEKLEAFAKAYDQLPAG